MNIWIKDVDIVTVDEDFSILKSSNIYIKENYIHHVGKKLDDFSWDKLIDGSGKVAMPGLINSHTHIGMSILRNYGNDVSLETWLNEYIWPMEKNLQGSDVYYASKLSLAEMIRSGTTSFVDMYFYMDRVAEATEEMGLRAVLTTGLINPKKEDFLREEKFFKDWNGKANGRIQVMLAPHAVYTNDRHMLLKAGELAEKLGVSIHTHLNESKTEVENSLKDNKLPPLEYMDSLGLLDKNTIAAHCVWLSDREIEIAKELGLTMVHNPSSNMKLASGFMDAQGLINQGINVALGTDGSSSNNTLDMIEEMKLASLIAKGSSLDPQVLTAKTVIEMATVNGAKAIGLEGILGRIKAGYLADLILIDFNNIHHVPNNDLPASIVYSTQSSDVDTTIVDGEILMENKKIKNLDFPQLKNQVESSFERLRDLV